MIDREWRISNVLLLQPRKCAPFLDIFPMRPIIIVAKNKIRIKMLKTCSFSIRETRIYEKPNLNLSKDETMAFSI